MRGGELSVHFWQLSTKLEEYYPYRKYVNLVCLEYTVNAIWKQKRKLNADIPSLL